MLYQLIKSTYRSPLLDKGFTQGVPQNPVLFLPYKSGSHQSESPFKVALSSWGSSHTNMLTDTREVSTQHDQPIAALVCLLCKLYRCIAIPPFLLRIIQFLTF